MAMFTTPTKRHHAEPRPVYTPEDADGNLGQLARLTSQELRNTLACSPKDKRAAVSQGYKNRSSPIPRAPLSATRSEPCISPYSSSITAPPLFATSQDMYAAALQNLSPQRGLQPMCDTFSTSDPWVPPARHGSASSASSSSSACSSNMTASTSYSADWNTQTRVFEQPASSGRSSKRELSRFEEDQQEGKTRTDEEEENIGDDTAMCLDPPSPSASRAAASRPMRPLRRKPLFGPGASSTGSPTITSSSTPRRGGGLDRTQSLPTFGSGDDWMRTDAPF